MIEFNYNYTDKEAAEVKDNYLGLLKQLDKMKKGRMMKVKTLSEISKRWLLISAAMIGISAIALLEFLNKKESYMLVFALVIFAYGIGCIFTSKKEKTALMAYRFEKAGCVRIDSKGIKELHNDAITKEFPWKAFEFCIVTESIITFFGKPGKSICVGYDKKFLEDFELFLEEQKMDADYVIKC